MIIDVSKFQGDIEWPKVKAAGIEGAIIRLGYTGYSKGNCTLDPKFEQNVKGVSDNGIPFSCYYFPQSISIAEAQNEAQFIIEHVKGLELSMPIFLDSEIADVSHKNGRSDKLSVEDRTRMLRTIADILIANGLKCGIYASTAWLNGNLDMTRLSDLPVWVAQYADTCKYEGAYCLWQYTSKATVDGISGYVDASKNISLDFASTEVITPVVESEQPSNKIKADGVWGEATTKLAQKVFGTVEDGKVSHQTEKCKDYLLSISDKAWEFDGTRKGSLLIKAIQRWSGVAADGIDGLMGKNSIKALQSTLKTMGFLNGNVDGLMGPQTVTAFQNYLNSKTN